MPVTKRAMSEGKRRQLPSSNLALFFFLLPFCSASVGKFNEAFTASMLDKVAASMAVPWSPLGSLAAAFSSNWFYDDNGNPYTFLSSPLTSAHNDSMAEDEDIRNMLWTMMRPYATGSNTQIVDGLYIGFKTGKLLAYFRSPEVHQEPAYLLYCKDRNATCPVDAGGALSGEAPCLAIYYNRTQEVTGGPMARGPSDYTLFDPTSRPWYQKSAASTRIAYAGSNKAEGAVGAVWSDPYLFTTGVAGLTAARQLRTSSGKFVGVAGADYELGTLQQTLADSTGASGGSLTVFVVDHFGFMISSSIPGAALSADESSLLKATECTNRVIAAVAAEVEALSSTSSTSVGQGWDDLNGTVRTLLVPLKGLHWFQSLSLSDPYGLKWHVVVAERAQCDRGRFVPTVYRGKDCELCPRGAECLGGITMPLPLAGYWIDRSEYAYGDQAYPCARGNCVGFRHKAANFQTNSGSKRNGGDDDEGDDGEAAVLCKGEDCVLQDTGDDDLERQDTTLFAGASYDDDLPSSLLSCFTFEAFVNASKLTASEAAELSSNLNLSPKCAVPASLECSHGSEGPLCGACEDGFTFSTSSRSCVNCGLSNDNGPAVFLACGILLVVLALAVRKAFGRGYFCGTGTGGRGGGCCTSGDHGDEDDDDDEEGDDDEEDWQDRDDFRESAAMSVGGGEDDCEGGVSSVKGGGGGGAGGVAVTTAAGVAAASSSSASSSSSSSSGPGWVRALAMRCGCGQGVPGWVRRLNLFRHVDRGMLKVLWSTAQILSTVSWNLALEFPQPFKNMMSTVAFSQLDFGAIDCYFTEIDLVSRVYFASLLPLALVALDVLVYTARLDRIRRTAKHLLPSRGLGSKKERRRARRRIENDAVYFALLLSYLVLPPVAMIQFHAMDCTPIGDMLVLHTDTSVDCLSVKYKEFVVFNAFLIAIYQSVPLVWLVTLWRIRHRLDPASSAAIKQRAAAVASAEEKGEEVDEATAHYNNSSAVSSRASSLAAIRSTTSSIQFSESAMLRVEENGETNFPPSSSPSSSSSSSSLPPPPSSSRSWQPRFLFRSKLKHRLSSGGGGDNRNSSSSSNGGGRGSQAGGFSFKQQQQHSSNSHLKQLSAAVDLSDEASVLEARARDPSIRHLAFLWKDYHPGAWYYEVVEVYRRILFTGVLPLLCPIGLGRIALGCLFSVFAVAVVREAAPFNREATNMLLVTGQYQILVTFLCAFIIAPGTTDALGLDGFLLGLLLVLVNVTVVGGAGTLLLLRWRVDERKQRWRRRLRDEELDLLERIMKHGAPQSDRQGGGRSVGGVGAWFSEEEGGGIELRPRGDSNFTSTLQGFNTAAAAVPAQPKSFNHGANSNFSAVDANEILARYLLEPKDVHLEKRIGVGSFGEVFHGKCLGQPVAVKSVLEVTEASVLAFRAEILLTATLRHPNIVNFVGACWGRDLTCLVLEWVPNGSLGDLLNSSDAFAVGAVSHGGGAHGGGAGGGGGLTWDEPLLRLATDVARGMVYLHGKEWFDEAEGEHKKCIIHRDLKPDNALVTDFLRAKISDFGTSRAKSSSSSSHTSHAALTMTAVGTPLYCAPEVIRAERYDEAVDVYSFGLLLMEMCVDTPVLSFLSERWRTSFEKKKIPANPMRVLRSMQEDGWRPVSAHDNDDDGGGGGGVYEDAEAAHTLSPLVEEGSSSTINGGAVRGLDPNSACRESVEVSHAGALPPPLTPKTPKATYSKSPFSSKSTFPSKSKSKTAWLACGPIEQAPPCVNDLLVRCCLDDPAQRPSFEDILATLVGPCSVEVEMESFGRRYEGLSRGRSEAVLNGARSFNSQASPGAAGAGDAARGGQQQQQQHDHAPAANNPILLALSTGDHNGSNSNGSNSNGSSNSSSNSPPPKRSSAAAKIFGGPDSGGAPPLPPMSPPPPPPTPTPFVPDFRARGLSLQAELPASTYATTIATDATEF